jgi:2-oxoglutarate dehydrogenase E1 component
MIGCSSSTTIRFSSAAATATEDDEPHENESFLTGTSSIYAEEMYDRYMNDPSSVHESWKHYFDTLAAGQPYDPMAYNRPTAAVVVSPNATTTKFATTTSTLSQSTVAAASVAPSDSLGIAHLIRAYQVNGHMAAKLDPLETYAPESYPYRPEPVTKNPDDIDYGYPAELTPSYHGFHASDLDRVMNFRGTSSGGNKGFLEDLANSPNKVTLRMILNELRKTYTGTLGVEYMVRDCFDGYLF